MSYGFPSGLKLMRDVLSNMNGAIGPYPALRELGHSVDEMEAFRDALADSGVQSIDAFLRFRPEFDEIGRRAIALSLLRYERAVSGRTSNDDWFPHVWGRLHAAGPESFHLNRLSVISFNYDRLFRHQLVRSFHGSFGGSVEAAAAAIDSTIDIVHPHGSLGRLHEVEAGAGAVLPYNPGDAAETVEEAARAIRLIGNDPGESDLAERLLRDSQRIVFLGNHYHPANMTRLGWRHIDPKRSKAQGSAFGLTELERVMVAREFRIQMGDPESQCLMFLRETVGL